MMAVRKNNTEVVKKLAALGADITLKDADDRTSMYIAAEEDCVETLKVWDVFESISNRHNKRFIYSLF